MQKIITFSTFFILLTVLSLNALGQHSVSGIVLDSLSKEPIANANVYITLADTTVFSNRSESDGKFTIKGVAPGTYTLSVNFIGYRNFKVPLVLVANKKPDVLEVLLGLDNTLLEDVMVQIAAPTVVLKEDTTEFNADSFMTEPYADADALIKQLPGVEVDEEGNLKVDGEEVLRIMVDGKEFFSSDPRIAMKTLPADVIDKVQLIDEKSDQAKFTGFDDGDRKKIINIVTKPDRRHGYFGKMAGGYGNADRYNTGGSLNAFNGDRRLSFNLVSNNVNQRDFSMESLAGGGRRGGNRGGGGRGLRETNNLAMNYNNEWFDKLEFNANYAFTLANNTVLSLVNREYLVGNRDNQFNVQNQESDGKNYSHRIDIKTEFELDSNQFFSFRPNFRYQKSNSVSFSENSTTFNTQEPINTSVRNQNNSRDNLSISGDFSYRRKLNAKGRTLSLTINGSLNSNTGLAHNLSLNEFYNDFLLNRTDTVSNENNNNGNGNRVTGRLSYTEPISEKSRLQANYSLRNANNYSNRETFEFLAETGQLGELNKQLSNEFRNDYVYHSGGIGYLYSAEKVRFDFGIDLQDARSKNIRFFPLEGSTSSHFSSYLPKASFRYRMSKDRNIQMNYSSATNAPNINQLQDVINNENSLNIRTGNPDLRQESGHRFTLSYKTVNREKSSNFSANINANFSNNKIVNSTFLTDHDTIIAPGVLLGQGGRFTKPDNVNGYYTIRGEASLGFPLKALKLNFNASAGAFHTRDIGLLNNELTYANSSGIHQRITLNSKISQKIIFSFSYSGNYNAVQNSLNPDLSYSYYNQNIKNDFTFLFFKGLRLSSTVNYHYNTGLTNDDAQGFVLWNASFGKKLFKKEQGEIALTAYDIFNKNTNLSRNISEQFIEDRVSNGLNQYFILSFTYNIRKFGGGTSGPRPSGRRNF